MWEQQRWTVYSKCIINSLLACLSVTESQTLKEYSYLEKRWGRMILHGSIWYKSILRLTYLTGTELRMCPLMSCRHKFSESFMCVCFVWSEAGSWHTRLWFARQLLWVITTADSYFLKGLAPYAQVSLYLRSVHNKLWLYHNTPWQVSLSLTSLCRDSATCSVWFLAQSFTKQRSLRWIVL